MNFPVIKIVQLTEQTRRKRRRFFQTMMILATFGSGTASSCFAQTDVLAQPKKPDSQARPADPKPAQQDSQQPRVLPRQEKTTTQEKTAQEGPTQFLRINKQTDGNLKSMQTSITRYRSKKGLIVDLIAAVHIGEQDYYDQLNRQFELYDVVLYELVAPQGTRVPTGGKKQAGSSSPMGIVSWMQKQTQSSLGLESQLEQIDYQKANFTHADLSPTEIGQKMAERGETPLSIGINAFSEIMRAKNKAVRDSQSKSTEGKPDLPTTDSLWDAFGDPLKMKRLMAAQFTQSGALDSGMGATLNQLLVVDRNAAAIEVLRKEIAAGKKRIAIFYGAAHMSDFEQRLLHRLDMKKTKQIWVDAWDLTGTSQPVPEDKTSSLLRQLLQELGK